MYISAWTIKLLSTILGSASNCPDKKTSNVASSIVGIWHQTPIRWSAMACNIGNSRKDDGYINSGNELILDNQKIQYGELDERYGGGGFEVSTYVCQSIQEFFKTF